ncbi:Membrane associated eicosanoid/glutathione metabolism-like domain superfamily [Fusarium oxysporum f. sp. vasinfectum]|nr:Membrane associated eicosanoid/glutathione metabolism-like domain superfamily [Fusarium oxysporum f. sp. vasinfectum]
MESFLGLDLTRNYSFFTVPAAFFIITFPHAYTITAGAQGTYDNCNPRSHKDRIANCQTLDKSHKQFLLSAKAATENGLETIGCYAAGILAANFAAVPAPTINILSLGYVVSRLLYNIAYLWLQDNPRLSRKVFTQLRHRSITTFSMFPINYLVLLFASTALALPNNPEACDTDVPAVTAAPKVSFDCDYSYCGEDDDVLWCFRFIPFTTINPTLGPLPGETRVSIGMCGPKSADPKPMD